MAIPDFQQEDFLAVARERVTTQFKDKPIFDKFLQLLLSIQEVQQETLRGLYQLRSIDTAVGAQLDIIGDIVGQTRTLSQADLMPFFGFSEDNSAETYGSLYSDEGGVWYSIGQPVGGNVVLSDENYRLFIKSKILKNRTASTPEEFLAFCDYIFGPDAVEVIEGDAEVSVYFQKQLTNFETYLLYFKDRTQLYPQPFMMKTVGVKVNYFDGTANFDSDFGNDTYRIWEETA